MNNLLLKPNYLEKFYLSQLCTPFNFFCTLAIYIGSGDVTWMASGPRIPVELGDEWLAVHAKTFHRDPRRVVTRRHVASFKCVNYVE